MFIMHLHLYQVLGMSKIPFFASMNLPLSEELDKYTRAYNASCKTVKAVQHMPEDGLYLAGQ